MDVYIPIANCQTVDKKVLSALSAHPLIDSIWIHPTREYCEKYSSKREDGRGGDIDHRRYRYIALNCLEIYKMAVAQGHPYFLMCNSDARMLRRIPKLNEMRDYLQDTPTCGMVAYNFIPTKSNPAHVAAGFSMCRVEAMLSVKLESIVSRKTRGCHCRVLCDELRAEGWECTYITDNSKQKAQNDKKNKDKS